MGRMRVSVEIEVELDSSELQRDFARVLATVAQEIGNDADPLHSAATIAAADGRVGWRVTAIEEHDLATCVSCGRRVPRGTADVQADGEICRRCSLAESIGEHVEQAVERSFRDGVLTSAILSDGPVGGIVTGTLINAISARNSHRSGTG